MTTKRVPWEELRQKYECGQGNYRTLGEAYGISKDMVGRRARAEDWRRPQRTSSAEKQCLLAVASALKRSAEQAAQQADAMSPKELREMTVVLRELVQLRQAMEEKKNNTADTAAVHVVLEGETEAWSK